MSFEQMEPMDIIRRIAEREISGELVCAAEDSEAHVYFQRGRAAWATSSKEPSAFARHLGDRCGIDRATFRQIVEECRKARRPIAELLVDWKLASEPDVREALRLQIQSTLRTLVGARPLRSLFLERAGGYRDYSDRFTFVLGEVWPSTSSSPEAGLFVREVVDRVVDARFAALVRAGEVIAQHPHDADTTSLPSRVGPLLDPATEIALVRAASGDEIIYRRDPETALVVRLREGAPIGLATASLADLAEESRRTLPPHPASGERSLEWHGRDLVESLPRIEYTLGSIEEALGFAIVGPNGIEWSVHRKGFALSSHAPLLARSERLFRAIDAGEDASIALALHDVWLFGAPLSVGSDRHVWLVLDRAGSPGLGWTLLASALRPLARSYETRREQQRSERLAAPPRSSYLA
jgi:hypothetical protein